MKKNLGYDNIYGYSPLENVDVKKMSNAILNNKKIIEKHISINTNSDSVIMVAGAGNGQEAVLVRKYFNLKTIGVDINIDLSVLPEIDDLKFEKQNLMNLDFKDNSFSIIYCNHVLEHVEDHIKVLSELSRVLQTKGILFIGFPNRRRLFGYVGASQKLSKFDIIIWNINDYKFRFKGKFRNQYGAHAGFTQKEFFEDAKKYFSKIISVRNEYMELKYPKYKVGLKLFKFLKIDEFIFPSNYFICIK